MDEGRGQGDDRGGQDMGEERREEMIDERSREPLGSLCF